MIAPYIFQEATPAAPGDLASSGPVSNVASAYPEGIAAGMIEDAELIDVVAEITGGTGGSLDVWVQSSIGPSGDWYDVIHFAQVAAGVTAIYRATLAAHPQSTTDAPVVIGKNAAPALGAALVVKTLGFDRLRLYMRANAGTSAAGSVKCVMTVQQTYTRNR